MIQKIRAYWRTLFDIREGERLRTLFMALYMMWVLVAYYILRPVSRALFLSKFEIDKLPWLYILIALAGGVLAYLYSKVAIRYSLRSAVTATVAIALACLLAIWRVLPFNFPWMLYVFDVWVKLFSIILVSQSWLVAANVFESREAKRIYGILGVSSVFGAMIGGFITAAQLVAIQDLLLLSGFVVLLAYASFLAATAQKGVSLAGARGAESEEAAQFSFGDIVTAIRRYRHLQVIIAIITVTYIVDVLVEFQWNAMAKLRFTTKEELSAYLGAFQGIYTNIATFALFILTGFVVERFGVSGTLQVMPVTVTAASLVTLAAPSVFSTSMSRLLEAAMRYSFNRTGMELLYLPLPADLKNRTKGFVDVFVDRLARGLGGMLLLGVTAFGVGIRGVALLVTVFGSVSVYLCYLARNQYISTVRKRLALRRLDLESARVSVNDPATVRLLEEVAAGTQARGATYALSTLAEAPGYDLRPLLRRLADSPLAAVRARVFELARRIGFPDLLEAALRDVRRQPGDAPEAVGQAVRYALSAAGDARDLARRLLDHPNPVVTENALEWMLDHKPLAEELITPGWVREAVRSADPRRRALAAISLRVRGDEGTEALHHLLADAEPTVAATACRSAGALRNRAYVDALVRHLGNPPVRAAAMQALVLYGSRIAGTLDDFLNDETVPAAVRRRIPRVLARIHDQRSADVLLRHIGADDLDVRRSVLRALNSLREAAPALDFGAGTISQQILKEVRGYYECNAALAPFRSASRPRSAAALLQGTLEARLRKTVERLFHLLGLRYPQRDIYAAWNALNRGSRQEASTAVDFLDSVLDRDLKRLVLPLLDSPDRLAISAREQFGIEPRTPAAALRELLHSGDPWLVCCALATAAELNLKELAPDALALSQGSAGAVVSQVARAAAGALA